MQRSPWASNVRKAGFLRMATDVLVLVPVYVPFVASNGLSVGDVFVLQALYAAAVLLLEVPTGHLSDVWGRRPTLLLATLAGCAGILSYCFGTSFAWFLAGELCFAFYASLRSGTLDAFTYESLEADGREGEYRAVIAVQTSRSFVVQALGALLGGLIAVWSLRATAWASLPFHLIALLLCLTLVEPPRRRDARAGPAALADALRYAWTHAALRRFITLTALLSGTTFLLVWAGQPYQQLTGVPLELFGAVSAATLFVTAGATRLVPRLEAAGGDAACFAGLSAFLVACVAAAGLIVHPLMVLPLILARSTWGIVNTLTSDLINRLPIGARRATILSVASLAGRGAYVLIGPLFGYAADLLSLPQALTLTAACVGVLLAASLLAMRPHWAALARPDPDMPVASAA